MTDPAVAQQLAEHQAAIDRLLASQRVGAEDTLRGPDPSALAKDLGAKAEVARIARARIARDAAAEREKAWEADAPRRAEVERQLAELDKRIVGQRAEVSRLEAEYGALRRTL